MPVKILAGYVIDGVNSGIDAHLIRVLEAMKGTDARIDFLTSRISAELEVRLKPYGSGLYEIPSLKTPVAQLRATERLIREKGYTVCYFNISEAFNCMGVKAARRAGCPRILVHSHSSGAGGHDDPFSRTFRTALNRIFRRTLAADGTAFYACSAEAGRWLFPKQVLNSPSFHIMSNTIDTKRFLYRPDTRERVRRELSLGDALVLGHVGGYFYYKNNLFLFRILKELLGLGEDAVLLSAGDGPDFEACRRFADEEGISSRVRMLGSRKDVPDLLQAMDIFVLPSVFEGQPISALEAQASGLPVLLSNAVTREADISAAYRMGIEQSPLEWAEQIRELAGRYPAESRHSPQEEILKPFDSTAQKETIRRMLLGNSSG